MRYRVAKLSQKSKCYFLNRKPKNSRQIKLLIIELYGKKLHAVQKMSNKCTAYLIKAYTE